MSFSTKSQFRNQNVTEIQYDRWQNVFLVQLKFRTAKGKIRLMNKIH